MDPAKVQPAPLPGYTTTTAYPQPVIGSTTTYSQAVGGPTIVVQQTAPNSGFDVGGVRDAIPELPMAVAVILCIVNIFFPGIGTILAGFSVLCCGNVGQSSGSRFGTFCINFWVGLAQLALVFFFVGWVWSIIWGFAFIALSASATQKQNQPPATTTTTTYTTAHPLPQVVPTVTSTTYVTPPV